MKPTVSEEEDYNWQADKKSTTTVQAVREATTKERLKIFCKNQKYNIRRHTSTLQLFSRFLQPESLKEEEKENKIWKWQQIKQEKNQS